MTDLLPCPFCGGNAKLYQSDPRLPGSSCNVECPGCGSESAWFISTDLAVTAWNTRALPPVTADPLGSERMRAKLIDILTDEYESCDGNNRAQFAIEAAIEVVRTITGPTDDDLDRAALARPKTAALVDEMMKIAGERGAYAEPFPETKVAYGTFAVMTAREALAALKGGE